MGHSHFFPFFFYFLGEGANFNWPINFFCLDHWARLNKRTSLDPSCKVETSILLLLDLFSLYTWESNFRQTIWDKIEVLLGMSWGTIWEHVENTLGTRENNNNYSPTLTPKRKKLGPSWVHAEPSDWLHETFISKPVCHHFWPGLMAGAQPLGHSNILEVSLSFVH
jgi:hypothetical protein